MKDVSDAAGMYGTYRPLPAISRSPRQPPRSSRFHASSAASSPRALGPRPFCRRRSALRTCSSPRRRVRRHDRAGPNLEGLGAAGDVRAGEELPDRTIEEVDVGVVAVIEAADLAQSLEEAPLRHAVLAEPGSGDVEGGPFGAVGAGDR